MKNYIGNNNEINKKKYKKSLPPKLNTNAGNVEYNIDMFNRVSNVGDAPSNAEGMSGIAEEYDRDSLISRIKEFGKNYNFSKYSNAQLYAMLDRLVDKSNHFPKTRRQDRINIGNRTMVNDPSYNFDDPDREGDYQVENLSIREALNRLDHKCIDEDLDFHDLRSLYENIVHQLSSQEKAELKNLLNTTSDPDAVKAYLDSKDPDKKKLLQSNGITEEIDDDELDEEVYRYTVECYSNHYDEPARYRFYDHDDAERFAVDCTRSKKYTDVIITSPRRNGISVENSWSKQDGWYKDPSFLIELDNDDIVYTDFDFDESLRLKKHSFKYNEAIDSNYRVDTWIDNKDKITPSKLKKEISSYPEGTYLRLCRKGAINAMNQYTYGFVKVEPDQWVAYSSIVGLSNNTPLTDYEVLRLVSKYNIKNLGVKISNSFSDNSMAEVDWNDETDVDFDESLKLKESSPVNYKKKISLIRAIDRGIPYSMRYKEADIVIDYDNDELILYWVTEDPFTKDELQEFAFQAMEWCHDMYDDIMQIALTYRGISKGFNSDDNGNRLIWIDAAGEWRDEDWDDYVNHMKKVGVDVQANDLVAADWEDSTDFDFDESLKESRFAQPFRKDIELLAKKAIEATTEEELNKVISPLLSYNRKAWSHYSQMIKDKEYSIPAIGKMISDDLYWELQDINNDFDELAELNDYDIQYTDDNFDESYSVQSNSITDSVDVIDDETKRVVSRHRGENALDSANHEKDVMNMNEDYTKADDDWGEPYTLDEVFDQLRDLTNDFTDKDGNVRCWYEQEKIYGVKVLRKYYNIVEVSDGRMSNEEDMSWVIAYSDPKEIKKKSKGDK